MNGVEDYWTQGALSATDAEDAQYEFLQLKGLNPLDSQLGQSNPKTVPDTLVQPLFGEQADKGRSGHTYAVLDAAKIMNLLEILDASGLEHRCLFQGQAFDDLKDVAPWVVRLEDGHAFTRNLFTQSDAPWHLWQAEPGIYCRSHATLDDIWRHFRKFTRVQDENGDWFFCRFWEPRILASYFRDVTGDVGQWFAVDSSTNIESYVLVGPNVGVEVRRNGKIGAYQQSGARLQITQSILQSWKALAYHDFVEDLQQRLYDDPNLNGGIDQQSFRQFVTDQVRKARLLGVTLEGPISDLVEAACMLKSDLDHFPPDLNVLLRHQKLPQKTRAKKIKAMAKLVKVNRGSK